VGDKLFSITLRKYNFKLYRIFVITLNDFHLLGPRKIGLICACLLNSLIAMLCTFLMSKKSLFNLKTSAILKSKFIQDYHKKFKQKKEEEEGPSLLPSPSSPIQH